MFEIGKINFNFFIYSENSPNLENKYNIFLD